MPIVVDPPRVRGVRVLVEAGKEKPPTVGIVAGRATRRASVGKRKPIRTKLDRAEEMQEGVRSRITRKARNELEMEWVLPS